MKKLLISIIFILSTSNLYAEVYLDCNMTGFNIRKDVTDQFSKIDYNTLKPSNFSAIIEYTGADKIIGRLIPSADTGSLLGPYIGTISDTKISMRYRKRTLTERGTVFELNVISGNFEILSYLSDDEYQDYWHYQQTGKCTLVE